MGVGNGGGGGNGVHKRRNGENGDETEKNEGRNAGRRPARRLSGRAGGRKPPMHDRLAPAGTPVIPPALRAVRPRSSHVRHPAISLLRFASVDSVPPFVNSVSSDPSDASMSPLAHSSRKSTGQVLMTRSRGMPASRASGDRRSPRTPTPAGVASLSSAKMQPVSSARRAGL